MEVKCSNCDEAASYEVKTSRVSCGNCGLDVNYKEYLRRYSRKMVQKGILISEDDWNPELD